MSNQETRPFFRQSLPGDFNPDMRDPNRFDKHGIIPLLRNMEISWIKSRFSFCIPEKIHDNRATAFYLGFDMTKEIELTQGKHATVSDEDYERISCHKWTAVLCGSKWYAVRVVKSKFSQRKIYMHREIMGVDNGFEVDHRDEDGLHNERYNLRISTHAQNAMNRGKQQNNTSGYKGVSWNKINKKWVAQIQVNRMNIYLGSFLSAEDAARARDEASKEHHGEFACLNFSD